MLVKLTLLQGQHIFSMEGQRLNISGLESCVQSLLHIYSPSEMGKSLLAAGCGLNWTWVVVCRPCPGVLVGPPLPTAGVDRPPRARLSGQPGWGLGAFSPFPGTCPLTFPVRFAASVRTLPLAPSGVCVRHCRISGPSKGWLEPLCSQWPPSIQGTRVPSRWDSSQYPFGSPPGAGTWMSDVLPEEEL